MHRLRVHWVVPCALAAIGMVADVPSGERADPTC